MANIAYHVFRKKKTSGKIKKNGKKETFYRWYYYYVNFDGKKIQKACPGCKNRPEAESYIRTLPPPPGAKDAPDLSIRDIAENMYIPGSPHVDRRRQLGKSIEIETLAESRGYIKLIIEEWGSRALKDIEADEVVNFLFKVSRSGSWKNRYIAIFKEIYAEAPRHGCKTHAPDFPAFALNTKKADILRTAELAAVFKPEHFPSLKLYVFFLLILSGGMRLGEGRAVRLKQIVSELKLLIIDGFCKKNGTRTNYNKKGTEENPKFRVAWLPDFTLLQVQQYIGGLNLKPDDYVFTIDGKPIRQEYAENVFYKALQKAGIIPLPLPKPKNKRGQGTQKQDKKKLKPPDGRKLTPHSLRFTYVSRMRRELSPKELLPMTGHVSEGQVNYYNRKDLELIISSLPAATSANTLLDFIPAPAI